MELLQRNLVMALGLGIVVYLALAVFSGLSDISAALDPFDWSLAPAILGLVAVSYVMRFACWAYYLRLRGMFASVPGSRVGSRDPTRRPLVRDPDKDRRPLLVRRMLGDLPGTAVAEAKTTGAVNPTSFEPFDSVHNREDASPRAQSVDGATYTKGDGR